jgi:alkanesulfonate monooxygenase SsuD/methylene tetrahydromethanopterin reductase-like flavin-dependent oxidoreductase (luciferase family)
MQLGFFTMPMHPLDKDWRLSLKEDREAFVLADELGFTEAYVGEHVTDKAENITSCIAFLAWVAAATHKIRLGTGTINMPNTHPAAVAASMAMLDHMLDGRLIFGISPGGLLSDAELFGNLDANRNEMFVEAINQVLEIWASEPPYNIKGKYWNVTTQKTLIEDIGQGFIAKPLQRPHPPVVVTAVAPFSKGVEEAAARGWDPISANFLMPAWVKSHWPKYVEGCRRGGRAADPANWRVAKSVFVAKDGATAKAYATDPDGPYVNYYRSLFTKLKKNGRIELFKTSRDQPDDEVTLETVCENLIIYGTADHVADQLLAFESEVGAFGTLLYAGKDWKDPQLGRGSMILMAEKVMPLVNAGRPKQVVAQHHGQAGALRRSIGFGACGSIGPGCRDVASFRRRPGASRCAGCHSLYPATASCGSDRGSRAVGTSRLL